MKSAARELAETLCARANAATVLCEGCGNDVIAAFWEGHNRVEHSGQATPEMPPITVILESLVEDIVEYVSGALSHHPRQAAVDSNGQMIARIFGDVIGGRYGVSIWRTDDGLWYVVSVSDVTLAKSLTGKTVGYIHAVANKKQIINDAWALARSINQLYDLGEL